ncbi:MAG: sugar phosphate nucleotidyltransferase [Candidatus Binataceae bacterium]
MHPANYVEPNRYAVILAGGDATRLMALSRRITGQSIPKQFCPIVGESTLLDQTRRRVALIFNPKRTIVVLTRKHEEFYRDQVDDLPDSNLVVQAENRGTAAAILYALVRIAKLDPYAVVTVFPSDHFVDNQRRFMSHAETAMRAATAHPSQLVLLGIKPDRAESGYGWIEPAESSGEGSTFLRVARFWEKPPTALAQKLWRRGCLWNSFVMAGTVRAFATMVARSLPELKRTFSSVWLALGTSDEQATMRQAYARLPCRDFSSEVLARNARALAVVPVGGVYWNDLGDPHRVYETLARTRGRPSWMSQRTPPNRNDFVRRMLPRIIRPAH